MNDLEKGIQTFSKQEVEEQKSSQANYNDKSLSKNGSSKNAVVIQQLCKSYGSANPTLLNFSMNVPKNTIYSLLGASGCGKTTLLSCIVGLREWDSGEILLFGKTPGSKGCKIPGLNLGYMPQDYALYNHLSVYEMIELYARLYNIKKEKLTSMWEYLCQLLELPNGSGLILDLSGGQKRRVSLALAMLHGPKLLVLDEPTVGLDPLLRIRIWDHLYKITNTSNTSVIITTHYVEEARQSHTIGIMRGGRLLAENTPENLLKILKVDLLEDAVVRLCREDEVSCKRANTQLLFNSKLNRILQNTLLDENKCSGTSYKALTEAEVGDISGNENASNQYPLSTNGKLNQLKRIYGLTAVMLLTYKRFPLFLFFVLFMPTIQGCITLWTIGSKTKYLHIGIINHELTNWTKECESSEYTRNSCHLENLSCRYISKLKLGDLMILDSYKNVEDALLQVHQGNSWGYIVFPENYTQSSVEYINLKSLALEESVIRSQIHAHLDYSQYISALFMVKHLLQSYQTFVNEITSSCKFENLEMDIPLQYRQPVYGSDEGGFTDFILPGILVSSLLGLVYSLAGLFLISDLKQGTLSRATSAGLTTMEIIASHFICQTVIAFVQIILWTAVSYSIFAVDVKGPTWLYVILCILVGLSGTGLGLVVGVICQDEVALMIIGIFWFQIFLLYGSVLSPPEFMSRFWQIFGLFVPSTMPSSALRSIIVRGLSWNHPLVWPGILGTCLWTCVFTILAVCAIQRFCH